LKVRIVGSPDPNWRLDGIPLRSRPSSRHAGIETFLVSANGALVQHWRGFTSAQNLGLAIQKLLRLWTFGGSFVPRAQ
jgi:hypothetical protein